MPRSSAAAREQAPGPTGTPERGRGGGDRGAGIPDRAWIVPAAIAVLAAAEWLSALTVPYLLATALATAVGALLAWRTPRGRGWAASFVAAAGAFCIVAGLAQRELGVVRLEWSRYHATREAAAESAFVTALDETSRSLARTAQAALAAPSDPSAAFAALGDLTRGGDGERAVVLLDASRPLAWAGRMRVSADSLAAPRGVVASQFYLALYASAHAVVGGAERRAVATALVHAMAPADRLSDPLDAVVARRAGVPHYTVTLDSTVPGLRRWAAGDGRTVHFGVDSLLTGTVTQRLTERSRVSGALLLALALVALVGAGWRRPTRLLWRIVTIGIVLAAIAIVPLNRAFSNVTSVFDATYYFWPHGGPFTASIGALALTAALALLAMLAVLRARPRPRIAPRALAALAVVAVAALGPYALARLSDGITPPARGVPTRLWLAWEIALFLAASAVLLVVAVAGRGLLGRRRGITPYAAPLLACVAALIAPRLWEAPGRWPAWYPAVWMMAIALLALARRSRAMVLNVALVAGVAATVLVWGQTARKRVALAESDVRGLDARNAEVESYVRRFAQALESGPAPRDRGELLQRYVASSLAPAGYPVELALWRFGDQDPGLAAPAEELVLSEFRQRTLTVATVVAEARRHGSTVMRWDLGEQGNVLLLAVPYADGTALSLAVVSRTQLYADDPFLALLGLAPTAKAEPPYQLTTTPGIAMRGAPGSDARWQRIGDELHGDWVLPSATGPIRAHVEVELRSPAALVQRGALIVLLDLLLMAAIWTVSAAAGGGVLRWGRGRAARWARSYRARLTVALFGFFVIPALAFAVWSYGQLQQEDRQSRELLVRETLRAIVDAGGGRVPLGGADGPPLDVGVPLFVYRTGAMVLASDPLYRELAPLGRFLRPDVELAVGRGDEVTVSRPERVGGVPTLLGFRQAADARGDRIVLAAPARSGELALDRQRRDLSILVLFATAIGGVAALTLSGLAARELSRPIGSLRRAAHAIAAGDAEPALADQPPEEFVPVFSAFRRMAEDLAASRSALEEARRRTELVLRNVASGVVGIGPDGRVALANPRAEMLLRRSLAPGTPLDAVGEDGLSPRLRAFLEAAHEEEDFDVEVGDRQLHARLTRLARGSESGAVLTLDDLTELARAQRVLAWGEMARQVAHEIKNPLTPIRLGVQHLRRAHRDGRVDFDRVLDTNVERILAEIDRLDEIARAFSRYGTMPEDRAPTERVDVAAVARDVVELERMGEGSVRWRAEGIDAPAWALARSEELREVLLNVLENARLAGAREVTVRRRAAGRAPADGRVVLEIVDDGHGIPEEVLPRIFEPHFSTRTSGSGLGLAISRRLVDAWGGEISVASEPARGTTVTIALATAPPS